jgi:hypothetical protein
MSAAGASIYLCGRRGQATRSQGLDEGRKKEGRKRIYSRKDVPHVRAGEENEALRPFERHVVRDERARPAGEPAAPALAHPRGPSLGTDERTTSGPRRDGRGRESGKSQARRGRRGRGGGAGRRAGGRRRRRWTARADSPRQRDIALLRSTGPSSARTRAALLLAPLAAALPPAQHRCFPPACTTAQSNIAHTRGANTNTH